MMTCLVYDKSSMPWDKTKGFRRQTHPAPVLDEAADPADAESVIVKVIYAGFCGSDRGVWYRTAFRARVATSVTSVRMCGPP